MVKIEFTYAQPIMCEGARLAAKLGGFEIKEIKLAREQIDEQFINGYQATIDGKTFKQGPASFRLIGKLAKVDGNPLYPSDPLKALDVDTAIEDNRDLRMRTTPLLNERDSSKKAASIEKLKSSVIPVYMPKFEAAIARNGGPYIAGKNLTIADLDLYGNLSWISNVAGAASLSSYPLTLALCKKVGDIPGIKSAKK